MDKLKERDNMKRNVHNALSIAFSTSFFCFISSQPIWGNSGMFVMIHHDWHEREKMNFYHQSSDTSIKGWNG